MDTNTKSMREDITFGLAEIISTIEAIEDKIELMETIRIVRTATEPIRAELNETTAYHETTKTEPDPGTMQSVEENQEIPKEDSAVMPDRGLRKRRRDQNIAARRHQKPKGRIRASSDSSRRLTVAGRKVSRRAEVAQRKRNVVRKLGPRECVDRGRD
jgi:hypothetical protein